MRPEVLRNRILRQLQPVYRRGLTTSELAAALPPVTKEQISRELAYLVEKGLVRPPTGYGEFSIVGGHEPMEPRYDITAEGVDYAKRVRAIGFGLGAVAAVLGGILTFAGVANLFGGGWQGFVVAGVISLIVFVIAVSLYRMLR